MNMRGQGGVASWEGTLAWQVYGTVPAALGVTYKIVTETGNNSPAGMVLSVAVIALFLLVITGGIGLIWEGEDRCDIARARRWPWSTPQTYEEHKAFMVKYNIRRVENYIRIGYTPEQARREVYGR